MTPSYRSLATCWSVLMALSLPAAPAASQPHDGPRLGDAELISYAVEHRVDPFIPPVRLESATIRLDDLQLRGTIQHDDGTRSVATFSPRGGGRPLRVRVGERVGEARVVEIRGGQVEIVVEHVGTSRRGVVSLSPVTGDPRSEAAR
jgi:hypothetical protein